MGREICNKVFLPEPSTRQNKLRFEIENLIIVKLAEKCTIGFWR